MLCACIFQYVHLGQNVPAYFSMCILEQARHDVPAHFSVCLGQSVGKVYAHVQVCLCMHEE